MLAAHDVLLLRAVLAPLALVAALVAGYALGNRRGALAALGAAPARGRGRLRRWWAPNAAKAWGERFFVYYSAVWIAWFGWVVVSGVWERFAHVEYLAVCGAMALPCALAPLWLQPAAEAARPWHERYWVKANVWIAVISYVGNYFWTHYFYVLLGADYTFPSWRINGVPIPMFLATHAYFCTYHTLTTMALRRWRSSATYAGALPAWLRGPSTGALVAAMAWATALTEAFTIQGFPYYRIRDRLYLYTVGGVVYGLYFVVSFPMFARLDEYADGDDDAAAAEAEGAQGGAADAPAATGGTRQQLLQLLPPGSPPAAVAPPRRGRGRSGTATRPAAGSPTSASPARAASVTRRRASASRSGALRSSPALQGGPGAAPPLLKRAAPAAAPPLTAGPSGGWSMSATVIDSLAACMAVTILLDLWRIAYLAYTGRPEHGLPWMPFVTTQ